MKPLVIELEPIEEPVARATAGLKIHRAPRPLSEGALVEDWPTFLGPRRDGHCIERPLATEYGPGGPPLLWELERGQGYAGAVIGAERLVFTHRVVDEVHVDCLDPETGMRYWRFTYPCEYKGQYIDDSGPRATPTIAGELVYVHGVDGELLCLALATGRVVWRRNTTIEFELADSFFGVVSSPLFVGNLLIQNVGAPAGPCVAAFRGDSGELVWGAGGEWGPSCASPVLGMVQSEARLFVIAGGKSRPPTGGLMVVDPVDGTVTCEYPFRSRTFASVNGASPVICGERVFLTAAYGVGSAVLDIDADGAGSERWKERRGLASEFSTPVFENGVVYAINGASGRAGAIQAIDPTTGKELGYRDLAFSATIPDEEGDLEVETSVGAGSLLHADGVFLVLGDTGHLATVRASSGEFELISDANLFHAPETWTPPVVSHGLLYVCQNNPSSIGDTPARLLCYDLRD